MGKSLVVVESPAKAKTLKKYLGSGYKVMASVGHIKDLPRQAGESSEKSGPVVGVDIDEGYKPIYEVIPGKEKIIKELRTAAKSSDNVLLATDPDREGEAIAWHLNEELKKPEDKVFRVLFNELTERAIKEAVSNPTRLDKAKYDAQQTRRILDRIVGYQLSPLLWNKVQYGLSAGRVQSVALRLIVDRQDQIDRFVAEEFWRLGAVLRAESPPSFEAKLVQVDGEKALIPDNAAAKRLVERAGANIFTVESVRKKERSKKASPPFITSTMQQDASRKLRMTGSRSMRIAQQLYEGIELGERGSVGLITYMRTDSPRIAAEALDAVRGLIKSNYGDKYLPDKPNVYKGKKSAQEAHECIRPTSMENSPASVKKYLDKGQFALYSLIWNRFVASQMAPAIYDQTSADIVNDGLLFRVSGSILKFDGYLKVYGSSQETSQASPEEEESQGDRVIPPLKKGQVLKLESLLPRQHFTQPPASFNEASLIKELEDKGIGRPSTYAEIVSTIQKRKYVEIVDKRFVPTILGRIIAKLLVDSFPRLLDPDFTAELESGLDLIEGGERSWTETLDNFYQPFQNELGQAEKEMKNIKRDGVPTIESCPECGAPLILRSGRYGIFLGCSAYPGCDFTSNVGSSKRAMADPVPTDEKCPECGAQMLLREGKSGPFLSCSSYPDCKKTAAISTGAPCPKCSKGELAQRTTKRGKTFFSCERYPECDYSLWNRPIKADCPNCDSKIMEQRSTKKSGAFLQCPECKSKVSVEEN